MKKGIQTVEDVISFFQAFNVKDWRKVFQYMHEDCIWDASEKQLIGKQELINYWTNYHKSFKETLGEPEHIVLGEKIVYLQVAIHLEFLEHGSFLDKSYEKGEKFDLRCADFYELDDDGMIKFGHVFIKPPHD